jgi:hypothetical protein
LDFGLPEPDSQSRNSSKALRSLNPKSKIAGAKRQAMKIQNRKRLSYRRRGIFCDAAQIQSQARTLRAKHQPLKISAINASFLRLSNMEDSDC